jgi:hypothetical protein
LILECGISGTLTTTQNQTGEMLRIVTWVNQAWNELQTEHDDWDWSRASNILGSGASFTTVAGQASYPFGTGPGTNGILRDNFNKWDRETFRNYTTSVGFTNEMFLDYVPYDVWRDAYMLGAMRNVQTRPVAFAIGPDKSICLGPPPNDQYTITGDYFMAPTDMSADTDLPKGLPTNYHMMIPYYAMMTYAGYESAPEVYQRGLAGYKSNLSALEAIQIPEMTFGGSL